MEVVREEYEYLLVPNHQPARQVGEFYHLPDKLKQVGFFFILTGISLLVQQIGESSENPYESMTAFVVFIIGVWFVVFSFVLRMVPMVIDIVPVRAFLASMEILEMYVFGLRIDLLF